MNMLFLDDDHVHEHVFHYYLDTVNEVLLEQEQMYIEPRQSFCLACKADPTISDTTSRVYDDMMGLHLESHLAAHVSYHGLRSCCSTANKKQTIPAPHPNVVRREMFCRRALVAFKTPGISSSAGTRGLPTARLTSSISRDPAMLIL
jgi:hypothetical protein